MLHTSRLVRAIFALFLTASALAAADDVLARVAEHADRFGAISRQIWENPELFANEKVNYGATATVAQRFLVGVAQRLGLSPAFVFAAYEDAFYYMWKERRLPSNVDPFESRLADGGERARLARIFEQGLDAAVGHVLPVSRNANDTDWQTGPWFLRQERCYLVPGDSPLGSTRSMRMTSPCSNTARCTVAPVSCMRRWRNEEQ